MLWVLRSRADPAPWWEGKKGCKLAGRQVLGSLQLLSKGIAVKPARI